MFGSEVLAREHERGRGFHTRPNQTFRSKSVSPEVLDQEQFACIISLIFLIFLKHSSPINFSLIKSIIFHSHFHLFLCFVISVNK